MFQWDSDFSFFEAAFNILPNIKHRAGDSHLRKTTPVSKEWMQWHSSLFSPWFYWLFDRMIKRKFLIARLKSSPPPQLFNLHESKIHPLPINETDNLLSTRKQLWLCLQLEMPWILQQTCSILCDCRNYPWVKHMICLPVSNLPQVAVKEHYRYAVAVC